MLVIIVFDLFIRIPPKELWRPDILLYNSVYEKFDTTFPANLVVKHTGSVSQIPPGIFQSTCDVDITWFPFDTQALATHSQRQRERKRE